MQLESIDIGIIYELSKIFTLKLSHCIMCYTHKPTNIVQLSQLWLVRWTYKPSVIL